MSGWVEKEWKGKNKIKGKFGWLVDWGAGRLAGWLTRWKGRDIGRGWIGGR